MSDWGLVLGVGSVGRRHARTLAALLGNLALVEAVPAAREAAAAEHPTARVVADLPSLDRHAPDYPRAVAVIATWGPSHAELFHALAQRGVRRILCEKPMAASVADADSMATRARREGIALSVHHYIRYAGLAPALHRVTQEHSLGPPVALVVTGGASCLVTNGIHWLDFAAELFDAAPRRVVSTAAGAPINPRSPDLAIYGGTAAFDFGEGREALLSLNNGSSVALTARVYYKDGVAELDGDLSLRLRRRDPEAVARFPAVTRTGPAAETLFEGVPPGLVAYLDGMRLAAEDVRRGVPEVLCPPEAGSQAVSACVGALVAARDGHRIDLPIDPGSSDGRQQWPIS